MHSANKNLSFASIYTFAISSIDREKRREDKRATCIPEILFKCLEWHKSLFKYFSFHHFLLKMKNFAFIGVGREKPHPLIYHFNYLDFFVIHK